MSWLGAPAPATAAAGSPAHALRHRHGARAGSAASTPSNSRAPNGNSTESRNGTPGSPTARKRRRSPKNVASNRSHAAIWRIGSEGWVREAFRRFGEHCARNQIRTLLIDCLVMTNLFYPSFAAFLERRFDHTHAAAQTARAPAPVGSDPIAESRSQFSVPALYNSFFPAPPPLLPNVEWGPWWASESGSDAAWIAADSSVGVGSSKKGVSEAAAADIDVLRVVWADVGHVLDGKHVDDGSWTPRDDQMITAVRTLAEGWETWDTEQLAPLGASCVRHLVTRNGEAVPAGDCYLLCIAEDAAHVPDATPLGALWSNARDDNTEMAAFPTQPPVYRGVAIPFHVPANRTAFEATWTQRLSEATAQFGAEVFTETYVGGKPAAGSTLVSFSPGSHEPTPQIDVFSSPPRMVLVLYVVLFTTLLMQLSNASKVHSRFGLAFTGVVQLSCSAVMSFSVLALLGWNGWGWSNGHTVLPTYVLPFVIVVVGAENMSTLTKAVFSVPFNHSVPVRIGIGLSKVGQKIALTSLTDLALLGLVWLLVQLQPVREFCIFAAVVIIADWFMLHTFFLTVLSIDAQRLELADVLASNGGLSSHEAERREEEYHNRKANRPPRFSWRGVLRARTVKSGSLLLLLTCLGIIYYYTESGRTSLRMPATLYGYTPTSTSMSMAAVPTSPVTGVIELDKLSPSEALWQSINPRSRGAVGIAMAASSIVIFPRPGHSMLPNDIRKLAIPRRVWRLPRLRPLFWFFKVIIGPQLLCALLLYILLLYLLKDSDLLAAQRNRLGLGGEANASDEDSDDGGAGVSTRINKASLATGVGVHMLPASHESDVDVISSSADGRLALSIGVDNSVCIWRFATSEQCSGTREMVSTDALRAGDPIVDATVSRDNHCVAVATRSGAVQQWLTPEDGKTEPIALVRVSDGDARVMAIAYDDSPIGFDDPFTASPQGRPQGRPTLLVALSNGAVRAVVAGNRVVDVVPACAKDHCRVDLLVAAEIPMALVIAHDGITLWRKQHGEWSSASLPSGLEPTDRVLSVACARVAWRAGPADLVALGRRSGRIEVFDSDGEVMATLGQAGDGVRNLAIAAPSTMRCNTCEEQSSEGFFVVSSTSAYVYVDRVMPQGTKSICRCPAMRRASALDDAMSGALANAIGLGSPPVILPPSPARFAGTLASATASPMKGGALAPPSNGEFPLSSHGARRLSGYRNIEAREGRTSDEVQRPPSPLDRQSSLTALSSLTMSTTDDSSNNSPATERHAWGDATVLPLGAVHASNGGWAVLGNVLVGVRRAGSGIDDSQWQLWALDLAAPWNGSSLHVEAAGLDVLERRTRANMSPRAVSHGTHLVPPTPPGSPPADSNDGEMPMRARRAERMLSMNGRASFPSALGSFSVPTHQPLGYVRVRPFRQAGPHGALAGFGNRVGVLTLPPRARTTTSTGPPTLHLSLPSAVAPAIAISTPRRPNTFQPTPPPLPPPPAARRGLSDATSVSASPVKRSE